MTTNADIYRAIGQLEGKVDAFIKQMAVADDRTNGIETRVRKVEGRQYWLAGVGAAFGMIAGAFGVHIKT